MNYQSVSSSTIAAIAYDSEQSVLGVRFLAGTEYHYFGVPQDVHDGLLSAASVGRFFDQYVKKAGYAVQKVG
jgi:hypothetical protein